MSSAFDTVDREKLMGIIKGILNPQDTKLIDFFLTKTKLKLKANNFEQGPNFSTNIGIPQGDGLSPVMFTPGINSEIKSGRKIFPRQTTWIF